jgi:hypothetical protein
MIIYMLYADECSTIDLGLGTSGMTMPNDHPHGLHPGKCQKGAVGWLLGYRPTHDIGPTGAAAGSLQNA